MLSLLPIFFKTIQKSITKINAETGATVMTRFVFYETLKQGGETSRDNVETEMIFYAFSETTDIYFLIFT